MELVEVLELLPRGLGHASGLTDPSPLPPLPPLQNQAVLPPSTRTSDISGPYIHLTKHSSPSHPHGSVCPPAPTTGCHIFIGSTPQTPVLRCFRRHHLRPKPTVDPATLAPRDQKPTNESVEPAPARAGSAASSTEHSSTRQGAQAGAEDRQHRAQSLPRSEGTSHPPTSAQATIRLRPSDHRCSSGWICSPATSWIYNKQELAQMLGSPGVDSRAATDMGDTGGSAQARATRSSRP